jgi:multicomponent Na+:H+ antiporter subunit D
MVHRIRGTYALKQLGGLYRTNPMLAALFLVPALALAGVPPFSGFFAKLALVKAGLAIEQWAIVAVALAVSMLTFFSMIKIWAEVFWKPRPPETHPLTEAEARRGREMPGLILPTLAVAALIVAIGLYGEPLMELALRAAEQLLNPAEYIGAVLGAEP